MEQPALRHTQANAAKEIVHRTRRQTAKRRRLRKELAIVRLGVADGWRRLRLVERVTSLVLLAHSIDDEHDDRDGKNQTDDCQADAH